MAGVREDYRLRDQLARLSHVTDSELVNMTGEVRVLGSGVTHQFGGMFDTLTREYVGKWHEGQWQGDGEAPPFAVVWEVSPEQFQALLFYRRHGVPRLVLIGAMSSGKTAIAARAATMLSTEFANSDMGVVGPTQQKLGPMRKKLAEAEVLPKSWVKRAQWNTLFEPPYILLKNGVRLQFVGAKAPSKQMGSPIHGFD